MTTKVDNLPVLLTLHVRSEYLKAQLCTLRKAGVKEVYISIDGPRNQKEREMQEEIFRIVEQFRKDFNKFEVRHSDINLGIAVAMISAIDWFFAHNKYGVVFEDDIKFESEVLTFFNIALGHIKDMPRVLLVSGVQPFNRNTLSSEVVFTNYPQIWGWATYASKWSQMRAFIFQLPPVEQQVSLRVKNFWQVGWKRVQLGYLDTWDLPIATGMLFSNKLCLLPPVNLTSNVGVDKYSTNTNSDSFPLGLKLQPISAEIKFGELPLDSEVKKLNSMFDREIYRIRFINIFSPILSRCDRFRFARKRKTSLGERI